MSCQDIQEEGERYMIFQVISPQEILQEVIGSPRLQLLSQTGHWWDVPCVWWHDPFMPSNFLCSFHAMFEGLGIILWLRGRTGDLESWPGCLWADPPLCSTQHFFSGVPLPSFPGASFLTAIITWETGPGLPLGPTHASAVLTSPAAPPALLHARKTFSNLKQKFCGLLWCVSHTFCLCQFSSFP